MRTGAARRVGCATLRSGLDTAARPRRGRRAADERLAQAQRLTVRLLATIAFFRDLAGEGRGPESAARPRGRPRRTVDSRAVPGARRCAQHACPSPSPATSTAAPTRASAPGPATRRSRAPRTGGRRMRRRVPAQPFLRGGPQRATAPPSPQRPSARGPHRRAQLPDPPRGRHQRRGALLRPLPHTLFDLMLLRVPPPPRPRRRRAHLPAQSYLTSVTA